VVLVVGGGWGRRSSYRLGGKNNKIKGSRLTEEVRRSGSFGSLLTFKGFVRLRGSRRTLDPSPFTCQLIR
jgi:hypothetical protein